MKLRWVIVLGLLFCLIHTLVFTRAFYSGGPDVETYYQYASRMHDGQVPYRDFAVEYPPGALAVFLIPRLFTDNLHDYGHAFTLEMLFFDLACLFLVLAMGRRLKLPPLGTLIIYTLSMLAVNAIMVQRHDLAPAALTLGSVYAMSRSKHKLAWALLALGTVTKLYPALLAPIFLLYQYRHRGWRSLVAPIAVFAAILAAVATPFLWLDRQGFVASFAVQSGRALQLESSYSSVLLMAHTLGLPGIQPYAGPVSFDLAAPLAEPLKRYSFVIMGVGLLWVYASYFRASRRDCSSTPAKEAEPSRLVSYSFLAILVFLLTSKVLSAQFIVWLYPLVPLVTGRFRHAAWLSFLAVGLLTWYIYPLHYYDLADKMAMPINVLFLRNALLVLLAVWLWGEKQAVSASDGQALTRVAQAPTGQ